MNFITELKKRHSLSFAVKDAMDNLPSGVCYFNRNGSIKLCNAAMYDIYRTMTGRDLQSRAELNEAMENCGLSGKITRDGNIFLFPDGVAWQYSEREIRTSDGRTYTEAVFDDISELYQKRRELEEQSVRLKEMYAEMRVLSEQLKEITSEQEILNMKTRLHDQMNMGIAAIRQVLRQGTASEENLQAVEQFRHAIRILQEENTYPQDELGDFIRDAELAGIRVNLTGELPEAGKIRHLLIAILREACINAARHASAAVLKIQAEMTEDIVVLTVRNDGKVPEREIVPRGGLRNLGQQVAKANGKMEIQSLPEFVLKVMLPLNGETQGMEATV